MKGRVFIPMLDGAPGTVPEGGLKLIVGNDWLKTGVAVDDTSKLQEASVMKNSPAAVVVEIDFTGTGLQVKSLSALETPHRIYDAYIRDSLLDGKPFLESEIGLRIVAATATNATAMLEIAPATLLFGGWHTQGPFGGNGAKFQRCMQSEIIGVNVPVDLIEDSRPGSAPRAPTIRTATIRTSSRRDPLGISKKASVYPLPGGGWSATAPEGSTGVKPIRPSEVNHGSITPSLEPGGVTMDRGEQMLYISFAALRQLRFGNDKRNQAAWTYLAALGLLAVVEREARGYSLRSGCDLVPDPDAPSPYQIVHRSGKPEDVTIDRAAAQSLYLDALGALEEAGFNMQLTPIRLIPQPNVVEAVRKSWDLGLLEVDVSERDGDE